jgi:hypothetical protein
MGHDLPDIKPLLIIVDNGSNPILVAAHIEQCSPLHNLRSGMLVAVREKTLLQAGRLYETSLPKQVSILGDVPRTLLFMGFFEITRIAVAED